jgi:hypothetical protein
MQLVIQANRRVRIQKGKPKDEHDDLFVEV